MSQDLESNEPMSDVLTDERIRAWIATAEKREMARSNTKQPQARKALSRDLRISFWTLTNLLRRRLKGVHGDLRDKIKTGMITHLEKEIRGLENELVMVRKSSSTLPEANILAAEAALEQARAFLKG